MSGHEEQLDLGEGAAALPAGATNLEDARLLDTQRAFDSVAADYDGPRGNNELIQRMRATLWRAVLDRFEPGSRLVDLGCGTGIDAVGFAEAGMRVLATDWSPRMVERTRARARDAAVEGRVRAALVGAHQLDRIGHLPGAYEGPFDGMYSNFGPLNCVPDLAAVAAQCARLVRPGGGLVFSVIGRICPWEIAHYAWRGRLRRAAVRAARGVTPVGMNKHTIWTRYYLPREFYRPFAEDFRLESHRALSLLLPPPYLVDLYQRHPHWYERLGRLDDRVGGWPLLREMGDHFLIAMRRR